jgi:acetylglutamate kinase
MNTLTIIKIGGNIIDDPSRLEGFLGSFAAIQGAKILVHGGGRIATQMGERLGITPHYVDGRRITDAETLELVTMVYGGLVNKQVVARLQSVGCNAIGLSGSDGGVLRGRKRPVGKLDYGFVGDLDAASVNVRLLQTLMDAGLTPVLAPLTYDGASGLLNTNADTIAQEIAKAFSQIAAVALIYCFEKGGLLLDAEDESSVISSIGERGFRELVGAGAVSGGMIPKLDNAFAAIRAGVQKVIIGRAEDLPGLISGSAGTQIQ